eukprot:225814_1
MSRLGNNEGRRKGKDQCWYYTSTGRCKFGNSCWFLHGKKPKLNSQPKIDQADSAPEKGIETCIVVLDIDDAAESPVVINAIGCKIFHGVTSMTLGKLREELNTNFGNKEYKIFYGNRELFNDAATLLDYGVTIPRSELINITINTMQNQSINISTLRETTIKTFMEDWDASDNSDSDTYSFQDYSITNHAKLHLQPLSFHDVQQEHCNKIMQTLNESTFQLQQEFKQFEENVLNTAQKNISSSRSISGLYSLQLSLIIHKIQDLKQSTLDAQIRSQIDDECKFIETSYDKKISIKSDQMRNQQIKSTQFSDQIRKITSEINQLQIELETLTNKQTHHVKQINKLKKEIDQFQHYKNANIKAIQDEITKFEVNYSDKLQQREEGFQNVLNDKISEFEKEYDLWKVQDVIAWIKIIENGYFDDDDKFKSLFDLLKKLDVNGKQMKQISILFLKSTGLMKNDCKKLFENIIRIGNKKNNVICGGCVLNQINTVIIPCYHQYLCNECASKAQMQRCPVCRAPIKEIKQTFMSGF